MNIRTTARHCQPRALLRAVGGFTLIELVMVIVIMGILAAVITVFMRSPIDAYVASGRRGALTDLADTVLRRIGRDVRIALPNSVRTPNTSCLELIPTKLGGRYRADGAGALDFSTADTSFNMLGANSAFPLAQQIRSGDVIAVYNLGITGADAYAGNNTATVTGTPTEAGTPVETTIAIGAKQFPLASASNRFHVIDAAEKVVSYVCSGGKLYRTVNATNFTSACPVSGPAIATNVGACYFDYNSSIDLARNALVRMVLTVNDSSGTESVSLQHEVHINNTP